MITVTNAADSDAGSFRQAIADAQENDTITFAPDVRGTIALASGELLISKALTIQGPGANLLTIDAGNASRVLRIDAHGRAVAIVGLTFTRGRAYTGESFNGGGIWNDSNLTLRACTVVACNAVGFVGGNDARGGGIYNSAGSIQLVGCTLNGNGVAGGFSFHLSPGGSGYGGALWNNQGATASLQNCTISGNTAVGQAAPCNPFPCGGPGTGRGAGIHNAGDLVIAACTIGSNSATADGGTPYGGGIWSVGNAQVGDSIVAGNTGGVSPDVAGTFQTNGFNLIGRTDGSMGFTAPTDQTGTVASPLDAKLDPAGLQHNGGSTQTIALQAGSPAIDHGDDATAPARDQRDYVRSGPADAGAFEFGGTIPVTLANISTRLEVETGDNVLIGGFIITGTHPKKVIVRAIGPSLPVAGALADPILELRDSSGTLIRANDNWRTDQQAEIIATTIPPTSDLESAVVETLPANGAGYTTIVRGMNNTTGVGLVEAYDLDRTLDSKLANISTRGLVQTDNNVMIAGAIVLGPLSQRVLVRAIGPSLPVAEKLDDPTLELRDGNGALIRGNDNWRSDQQAEILATGIPPSNDLESAMVETLPGGGAAYTAIVRGVNGATGVALVEVYSLN